MNQIIKFLDDNFIRIESDNYDFITYSLKDDDVYKHKYSVRLNCLDMRIELLFRDYIDDLIHTHRLCVTVNNINCMCGASGMSLKNVFEHFLNTLRNEHERIKNKKNERNNC